MARLQAQANWEYIPTHKRIRSIIKSYLSFPEAGTTCLDPCCGPGDALIEICPNQHLFGLEVHTGRALEAKTKNFINVLVGPFENCVISNRVFGFIHLNPPYDWVAGGEEKYEELFLYRATNYLGPRGVLEYLVPTGLFQASKAVGIRVYKFLLENYRDIQIFKYPQPEYSEFKQIVIFGVKKPSEPVTASLEWLEKQIARIITGDIPELSLQESPIYEIPLFNPGWVKTFRINYYDAELAAVDSQTLNLLQSESKPVLKDKLIAPSYLDKALLALLAVGGYIDGRMPGHILLGRYENREESNTETDTDSGDEIHSTRKVSSTVFYAMCKNPGEDGSRVVEIR
ncbi:DUF6094 domain-containing protein [Bacteroides sp.]|uniref:DUF6094 domain-containing protein n=1 Tax=Bacteroides sp. TaxID=29523 RepID=UPI002630CE2B|nr:DUF6094 domain-containing protein [Bacteroides sp.]MDD3040438.1 DUF6094 domain-containing protein [Bacteroides sp.]